MAKTTTTKRRKNSGIKLIMKHLKKTLTIIEIIVILGSKHWSIFAGPDASGSAKMTHQPQGGRIVDKLL